MKIKRLIDFTEIKNFVIKRRGCTIDGLVFRLHYRATVIILVGFCLMVTAKQFFGTPISCIISGKNWDAESQDMKVVTRYCFISTTFSVNSAWKTKVGQEVPYPGVDKRVVYNSADKKENSQLKDTEVTFHAYYQWVCFVLLLQAVIFYLPHLFWKCSEGRLTKGLLSGLDEFVLSKEERKKKVDSVTEYLLQTSGQHNSLVLAYTCAEVLTLLNVVGQMMLVDRFLGGQFSTYGLKALGWKEESEQQNGTEYPLKYDPMMKVFPRMTKCTFHTYGSSGDVQKDDVTCVLPINIVNEKGYLFLWFWLYLLVVLTLISFSHSLLLLLFPCMRVISIINHSERKTGAKRDVQRVLKYGGVGVGDFFLLRLLAKNMTKSNFGELMHQLAMRIAKVENQHKKMY